MVLVAVACKCEAENLGAPARSTAPASDRPSAIAQPQPAPTSRPVPLAGAPAPENIAPNVALQHLNEALRIYYAEKFELPATIANLYAAGCLKQRFQAPDDKEFVINRTLRSVELKP